MDAEGGFLVFEINFDFPAPEVVLQDFHVIQAGIGADQISRIAIKQPGFLRQAVAQRLHDQNPDVFITGDPGANRRDGFDFEAMPAVAGEGIDRFPAGVLPGMAMPHRNTVSVLFLRLVFPEPQRYKQTGKDGKVVGDNHVNHDIMRVIRWIGLEPNVEVEGRKRKVTVYGFHSLRHSFASHCAEAGVRMRPPGKFQCSAGLLPGVADIANWTVSLKSPCPAGENPKSIWRFE